MPASFVLTVDLTAPQITWGPVDGAVASEEMTVLYLVDEAPGVVSAELQLSDGRVLTMAVLPDRLVVLLPDDAPDGWSTISALLADDVGNEATATLPVLISGAIPVPPPSYPSQDYPPEEPIKRWKERAVARSRYIVIRVHATSRARLSLADRYIVQRDERRTTVRLSSGSVTRTRTYVFSASRISPGDAWSVVAKRAEGPEAEADLLILGIL